MVRFCGSDYRLVVVTAYTDFEWTFLGREGSFDNKWTFLSPEARLTVNCFREILMTCGLYVSLVAQEGRCFLDRKVSLFSETLKSDDVSQ